MAADSQNTMLLKENFLAALKDPSFRVQVINKLKNELNVEINRKINNGFQQAGLPVQVY